MRPIRRREEVYMAPHRGSFDEIINNAHRGQAGEREVPRMLGVMEIVDGPLADETIDGAEIAPGLEGVQVKIWRAQQPEIQGVAVTFEGPNANRITLLREQRVFDSVDAVRQFLAEYASRLEISGKPNVKGDLTSAPARERREVRKDLWELNGDSVVLHNPTSLYIGFKHLDDYAKDPSKWKDGIMLREVPPHDVWKVYRALQQEGKPLRVTVVDGSQTFRFRLEQRPDLPGSTGSGGFRLVEDR